MGTVAQRLLKNVRATREAIARDGGKSLEAHVPQNVDLRAIRRSLGLTQAELAARFAIPLASVRNWEQGARQPEGPARVLLQVIAHEPAAVERALEKAA